MPGGAEPRQAAAGARRPGRPRSARRDTLILSAVLDLLAEGRSVEGLTIEEVAARAGVGRATIYRRWTGKEQLLAAAVGSLRRPAPAVPGTSTRDDLTALLDQLVGGADQRAARMLTWLVPEAARRPECRQLLQRWLEPYRVAIGSVLRRGHRSPHSYLDVEAFVLALVAPVLLQRAMPYLLDLDNWIPDLVDAVLAGHAQVAGIKRRCDSCSGEES